MSYAITLVSKHGEESEAVVLDELQAKPKTGQVVGNTYWAVAGTRQDGTKYYGGSRFVVKVPPIFDELPTKVRLTDLDGGTHVTVGLDESYTRGDRPKVCRRAETLRVINGKDRRVNVLFSEQVDGTWGVNLTVTQVGEKSTPASEPVALFAKKTV